MSSLILPPPGSNLPVTSFSFSLLHTPPAAHCPHSPTPHKHTHPPIHTTNREAALQVAKTVASRDWTPEYTPPSIMPERFKKGQFLRKAATVSAAMILKV